MKEFLLSKRDFKEENVISYGNMFLLGNGHLGYRGTLEEYNKKHFVGLNIVGFYDQYHDCWRESINVPNPFYIIEKHHNCLEATPKSHLITLDLQNESFLRKTVFQDLEISSRRTISQTNDNLLLEEYQLVAKEDVNIDLLFGLDIDIYEINGPHFQSQKRITNGHKTTFHGISNENKHLYMDVYYDFSDQGDLEMENGLYHLRLPMAKGETFAIKIYAQIYERSYNNEVSQWLQRAVQSDKFDELFLASQTAFQRKWSVSDVQIEGDPAAQFNIRYSIYHLLILGNEKYAHSIPARGVSGQTYKGAIFWDAEIFIFPFFMMVNPLIARRILEYRIQTLEGAKAKAKELGYEGAFYAWESQDSGLEACSKYNVCDPVNHKPIRTYFNEKQIHISPDIVYAIDDYVTRIQDYSLLNEGGFEIITQVALFIMSYATYHDDGYYHIDDVIGPDEYHERIDDNAFTSYMCDHALGIYLKYAPQFKDQDAMIQKVSDFKKKLFLPLPDDNHVFEQFKGYFALEDVIVEEVKKRVKNDKEYWGSENGVATSTRVIKQADVISMLCLLSSRFSLLEMKSNYDFYDKYTEHGSSLSRSMYSQCASHIGYTEEAYKMFMKSAAIDLGTDQKMFAGGIYIGGTHPASSGGAYLSLINGFAGMRFIDNQYTFTPHLPEHIASIRFRYFEKSVLKEATIQPNNVTIKEVLIND